MIVIEQTERLNLSGGRENDDFVDIPMFDQLQKQSAKLNGAARQVQHQRSDFLHDQVRQENHNNPIQSTNTDGIPFNLLNEVIENRVKIRLLEKEREKDKTLRDNSILNMSDQLKIEVNNKDSQVSRNYKLTLNTKFEMFEDYLKSELRIKKLHYVLDDTVTMNLTFDESKRSEDKFKVRDILINRIDVMYYNKIINLTEPKEILSKLKEVKRYESKTTSITARKELLTIKYVPSKENASNFYDRFQEKVRAFENIPDAGKLSEKEKHDYFIQAVAEAVPEITTADCLFKETTSNEMSCEKLKNYLLQVEATKPNKEFAPPAAKAFVKTRQGIGRQICRGCGMEGHIQAQCPHPGMRQCYYCLKLGSHLAHECRKRKADEQLSTGASPEPATPAKRGKWTGRGNRAGHRGSQSNRPTTAKARPAFTTSTRGVRGSFSRGRGRGRVCPSRRGAYTQQLDQAGQGTSLQAIADNYEGKSMILDFIADSGATEHMSKTKLYFENYNDQAVSKIDCANKDSTFKTDGTGTTRIATENGGIFELNNILYSKDLSYNLLSLRRFVDLGLEVYLNNKVINIYDPELDKILLTGSYNKPFWTIKLIVNKNCDQARNAKILYNR